MDFLGNKTGDILNITINEEKIDKNRHTFLQYLD
jgi:hypothetical protein